MTTTPTASTTDQPAPTSTSAPMSKQFPTTASFPTTAGASAYPPPAYGSVPADGPVPGHPSGDRPGSAPAGFAAEASTMVPPPAPARRRTAFLVAGCTLLAVALLQLTRLPEWIAYDQHGLVGNLTGVVALVGIGIALILTGRERRR